MITRTTSGVEHTAMELVGRFDAHEVASFRAAIDSLITAENPTVRIDMTNVIFVDSSALAELIRVRKNALESGGDVVIVNPSDPVRIILELTNLDSIFTIVSGSDS
jgi:anti-sigma B factor antagonist